MVDKQKHLEFLRDLKVLMEKHGVTTMQAEFSIEIDIDIAVYYDDPNESILLGTASLTAESIDKSVHYLEKEIRDNEPVSLNPESFVAIPEVWGKR